MAQLNQWKQEYCNGPVLSSAELIKRVRTEVNPLASDNHINQLLTQLEITGKVMNGCHSMTQYAIVW